MLASEVKGESNLPNGVPNKDSNKVLIQSKVASRLKHVDHKLTMQCLGVKKLPNSDWRRAEIYCMKNWSSVLYFQRGDQEKNRPYNMLIVATSQCLENLRKYGSRILGAIRE